jgi:pimeloyl-ACP methyl ester carboxylesterase
MPPQLTNETLGPLLEGAYRRFRYAQATVEPNINFPMPVDMATVFADTPPWPKWLGTLDRAPLSAIISIRRMQELIMNKIKFLPTDFPIFVIHSEDDDLCNVACAKDFFDQIPSRQKEFIRVPGPHLPLISQAVTVKDGLQISENDASMHRSTANNLMFDCFIELMNLTDQ